MNKAHPLINSAHYTLDKWNELFFSEKSSLISSKEFENLEVFAISYIRKMLIFLRYSQYPVLDLSIENQKKFWSLFKSSSQNLILLSEPSEDKKIVSLEVFVKNFYSGWKYGDINWVETTAKKHNLALTFNVLSKNKEYQELLFLLFGICDPAWTSYLKQKVIPCFLEPHIPTNNKISQLINKYFVQEEQRKLYAEIAISSLEKSSSVL